MCDPSARLQELLKTRNGIREAVDIAKAEIAEHAGAGSAAGLYSSALFNLLLDSLAEVEKVRADLGRAYTNADRLREGLVEAGRRLRRR